MITFIACTSAVMAQVQRKVSAGFSQIIKRIDELLPWNIARHDGEHRPEDALGLQGSQQRGAQIEVVFDQQDAHGIQGSVPTFGKAKAARRDTVGHAKARHSHPRTIVIGIPMLADLAPRHGCCRSVAALIALLLAACAQVPRQGYTSAPAGAMAYALAGPQSTPVVVLQSGLGDGRATWNTVWPQLAARHRVFALDRPGYGDSPSTSTPRDPCQAARELHAALHDAHVPPPYLLVGHSLGGLYQAVFARLYPEETAGLLLLDPTHPEHWATLQRDTPKTAALLSSLRSTVFTPTMRAEFDAQALCLDRLPPWPSTVPARLLFSGRFGPLETTEYQHTLSRLRLDWQQRLGAPAETVPTSGHYLHRDAPERVLQALARLLDAAATPPGR